MKKFRLIMTSIMMIGVFTGCGSMEQENIKEVQQVMKEIVSKPDKKVEELKEVLIEQVKLNIENQKENDLQFNIKDYIVELGYEKEVANNRTELHTLKKLEDSNEVILIGHLEEPKILEDNIGIYSFKLIYNQETQTVESFSVDK